MVLVPQRPRQRPTDRTPTFGPSDERRPQFGAENGPKFKWASPIAKEESGTATIEYGLLAALIALGIVTGLEGTGERLQKICDEIAEVLGAEEGGNPGNGKGKGKGHKK